LVGAGKHDRSVSGIGLERSTQSEYEMAKKKKKGGKPKKPKGPAAENKKAPPPIDPLNPFEEVRPKG
jgi:hypothetical protein